MRPESEEIVARGVRLRDEMKARNLDAVLLDDSEALDYFTGYETYISYYRAAVLTADGRGFYVLRALDTAPMIERSWIEDVVGYPDWESGPEAVAKAIAERGLASGRIGLDLNSHGLTVQTFETLKRALPGVTFVDLEGLPWLMRKVKSASEIAKLRTASGVADRTMRAIIDAARPGITEREAAAIAVESYMRLGADGGNYGIITAGAGWDFLHGHLHDTPLEGGDVLHLELIPQIDGYSARLMRCVVIGRVKPELQKLADTLQALQDTQIAALRPGAKAKDVDRILRQGALDAGLRETYDNITGYTLGFYSKNMIRGSDFTWVFKPDADWIVEHGMVFHMYASAGGIAISETVLVNEDGPERLTKIERKLYSTAEGIDAGTAV